MGRRWLVGELVGEMVGSEVVGEIEHTTCVGQCTARKCERVLKSSPSPEYVELEQQRDPADERALRVNPKRNQKPEVLQQHRHLYAWVPEGGEGRRAAMAGGRRRAGGARAGGPAGVVWGRVEQIPSVQHTTRRTAIETRGVGQDRAEMPPLRSCSEKSFYFSL